MKELSVKQMEIIQGGRTEAEGTKGVNYWLCNAAFIQLGAWNSLAFGLAGLTGAGIIATVIIGVTAAAVC